MNPILKLKLLDDATEAYRSLDEPNYSFLQGPPEKLPLPKNFGQVASNASEVTEFNYDVARFFFMKSKDGFAGFNVGISMVARYFFIEFSESEKPINRSKVELIEDALRKDGYEAMSQEILEEKLDGAFGAFAGKSVYYLLFSQED